MGHNQRSSYGLRKPSQWTLPSGILGRALYMGKRQHAADTLQRPHLAVYATCSFASLSGSCEDLCTWKVCLPSQPVLRRYGKQTREAAAGLPVICCPVSAPGCCAFAVSFLGVEGRLLIVSILSVCRDLQTPLPSLFGTHHL